MEEPPSREASFCPRCGAPVDFDDRFCRACGHPLVEPGMATPDGAASGRRRSRRAAFVALSLLLLAVLAIGGAVLVSARQGSQRDPAREALLARQRALKPALNEEMRVRDAYLRTEARYSLALADAREVVQEYLDQVEAAERQNKRLEEKFADEFEECSRDIDVRCPDPEYAQTPDAPNLDDDARALRKVTRALTQLEAEVGSLRPPPTLSVLHTQLTSAIETTAEEAQSNTDVLLEAVIEGGEGGSGVLDESKVKTLRRDTALPAIRHMNRAAVEAVRMLELPAREYEIPGGRDSDLDDRSHAT